MRFILSCCLLLIFGGPTARAEYQPLNLPFHIDLSGGWGYSNAKGQSLTSATSLGAWNFGATFGALMGNTLFFGVSSDYRTTAQVSDVNDTDGNISGSRWNLASPTIGFRTGSFVAKFDYQLLGDYVLLNKTASGASLRYTGPQGWRATALYQLSGIIHLGAFYENVNFTKQVNSTSGEMTLSPELSVSQFGANLGFVF